MKKFLMLLCTLTLVLGSVGSASAVPVQWEGNGHYYEVMTTYEIERCSVTYEKDFNKNWKTANRYSDDYEYLGETSYFATVTSKGENDFIAALVASVGETAFLGGTDKKVETTWEWAATGEAFVYTNWQAGEPNNVGCFGEDYLEMYTSGTWNDVSKYNKNKAYVVEYNGTAPVPEPATILLMGLGLFGMVGVRRRMNK